MGEGCVCSHTTAKYKLFHTHIHMQYHKCTRSLESKTVIFFYLFLFFAVSFLSVGGRGGRVDRINELPLITQSDKGRST